MVRLVKEVDVEVGVGPPDALTPTGKPESAAARGREDGVAPNSPIVRFPAGILRSVRQATCPQVFTQREE